MPFLRTYILICGQPAPSDAAPLGSRTVEPHLKMATKETSDTKIIFPCSAHVVRERIPTLFIKQFDTLSCSKGGDPTSKPDFHAGGGSLKLCSAGATTQSAAQPSDATRYSPRLLALLIFPRLAQRKPLKPADPPSPQLHPPQTPRPSSRFSPPCGSNGCKKTLENNLFGWRWAGPGGSSDTARTCASRAWRWLAGFHFGDR